MSQQYAEASAVNSYEHAFDAVDMLRRLYGFDNHDELFATPVSGDMLSSIRKGAVKATRARLRATRHLKPVMS